jgi:hypothetical protein
MQSLSIREAAQRFADWCHRVGETSPRPISLTVWIQLNAPGMDGTSRSLAWTEFVRAWAAYRRHA